MFSVPFELWVVIILLFLVCGGLVLWVISEWRDLEKKQDYGDIVSQGKKVTVITCKYCGAIVEIEKEEDASVIVCPVCESYL